jgi:flagellar hook-basal body complex protein FliE
MQTASIANAMTSAIGSNGSGTEVTANNLLSGAGTADGQAPFAGLLKNAIGSVQSLEDQAASEVQGLMTGQGVDIHQAMIATQKADMSFEMALAVRSKAVAAYQQVMQMQF